MMTVHLTCPQCQLGIHVHPNIKANAAKCDHCGEEISLHFNEKHEKGIIEDCPCCQKKDFYIQKDFNRNIGLLLFLLASVLAIFTYGLSFIILYLVDFYLFRRLHMIVVCYKCGTIFRNAANWSDIDQFDHEKHDRIIYSGHDFQGM